jgi:hypothetical protein
VRSAAVVALKAVVMVIDATKVVVAIGVAVGKFVEVLEIVEE